MQEQFYARLNFEPPYLQAHFSWFMKYKLISNCFEERGWSWGRTNLFTWKEELIEWCRTLLANFPLHENVDDVWQ